MHIKLKRGYTLNENQGPDMKVILKDVYFCVWSNKDFKSCRYIRPLRRLMMLLLLSHFSRVLLCATPETAAHQALPSLGFSRQEHWSGVAISFSNAWKWKVKVKSLSHVRLLATSWTIAYQAPPSMGFSRQEHWSGVPLPSPRMPI